MKIALFASGNGSNFAAMLAAIETGHLSAEIGILVCDQPEAVVVERAKANNIETFVFKARQYKDKATFETKIIEQLQQHEIELVVLAGYMRLIGPTLLTAYEGKIINIHPSLLPAYAGKDAIERAYAAGEKEIGITIHYVDAGMDTGEPIAQFKVARTEGDTLESLEARLHQTEHVYYPQIVQQLIEKMEGTVKDK
ncbi:phosphoribosylglycinamide formyltransferase [Brochothrix thermosphacta]|uniref:phosphoribosylglycinamide formyltransferase n=1 Tax=Brochothrix thermosphacta TaxID=2756 RepID=UPI00083FA443|nr:phosphoribosylglycinamide formyltransferase [Brochothrix thermosphacta]ANZ97098.1 phosphoribosylglycinamide formyltransferase [Brochothrix thermosphacta]ODJ62693.1 phosphoribosylglycinamide formyltransferase [Brochothrix thermosphacta]ODJ66425.1 phosphoribosylglycinamide formyltransferase [Brochothrix thermosphacta]